jgi:hypothetical protein
MSESCRTKFNKNTDLKINEFIYINPLYKGFVYIRYIAGKVVKNLWRIPFGGTAYKYIYVYIT